MTMQIVREPAAKLALQIIERLRKEGFIAYLAGGCVRDALLGLPAKDYDVATSATPESITELFGRRRSLPIGAAFGVISVLPPKGQSYAPVEVATFRSDGRYLDGRRPDSVRFGDPESDAKRRDFTINGLFYDPLEGCVIDFVEGQKDLRAKVVRAIGDPDQRFAEDKLRMLRAIRFTAKHQFRLDPQTADAIQNRRKEVLQTSGERIGSELRRMLADPFAGTAMQWLAKVGLAEVIMPKDFANAVSDLTLIRLLAARKEPNFVSGLALMLGFVYADRTSDGFVVLDELFANWKLSTLERQGVAEAFVGFQTLLCAYSVPWSKVQPVLASKNSHHTFAVAEAWAKVIPCDQEGIQFSSRRLSWPAEKLNPPSLLNGTDLMSIGLVPGPHFRTILETIRAAQLDGTIHNAEQARELAVRIAKSI